MTPFQGYVGPLAFLENLDSLHLNKFTDTSQSTSSESGHSPNNEDYNWLWPADVASQGSDLVFIDDEQNYSSKNTTTWLDLQGADWHETYDNAGVINSEGNTGKLSKRKTQNRAAQRAFRERKERSLRELKESVTSLTLKTADLESENQRLTGLLHDARAEVETLRSLTCLPESFKDCSPGDCQNCSKAIFDGRGALLLRVDLSDIIREQQFAEVSGSRLADG